MTARADLGAAANYVPSASLVGKGRLTFLGFKIFDAELYAPGGTYSPSRPFALKLTYLRNFKGRAIAKRSADEMRKLGASEGQLAKWTRQMEAIFPNVSKGQSITGVRTSSDKATFYLGNRRIGTDFRPGLYQAFLFHLARKPHGKPLNCAPNWSARARERRKSANTPIHNGGPVVL